MKHISVFSALILLAGCQNSSFTGKMTSKVMVPPGSGNANPNSGGNGGDGAGAEDPNIQVPYGAKPMPATQPNYGEAANQQPPTKPELSTFSCEISAPQKVYLNSAKTAAVSLKTGVGTVKAEVNGIAVPAAGGSIDLPLATLLSANQQFGDVAINGVVTDKSGNIQRCTASIKAVNVDMDFSYQEHVKADVLLDANKKCDAKSAPGVLSLSMNVKGLFAEDNVTGFAFNPFTEDTMLVECKPAEAKIPMAKLGNIDIFSQKITCLGINRGSDRVHVEYLNNFIQVGFAGANVAGGNSFLRMKIGVCVLPDDDRDAPCQDRPGRTVVHGVEAPASAKDKTLMCPDVLPSIETAKTLTDKYK